MMQILVVLLVLAGLFFMLVAAIGFIRLPDLFCRMHVTGILDTFGVPLVLLAIAIHVAPSLTSVKLLFMIALLYMTCPLIGNLLSRAALESGARPQNMQEDLEAGPLGATPREGPDR